MVCLRDSSRNEDCDRSEWDSWTHQAVGAISRCATSEIPQHGALVDEGDLERLLADVEMTFMRMTSYDGFLIWEPAAREP